MAMSAADAASFPVAIPLTFTCGAITKLLPVNPRSSLGGVQATLCKAFGQRFPATLANVVSRGVKFDEFRDRPFALLLPGEGVGVEFSATDDPFFYDVADRGRRGQLKVTLEEEVAYEEALTSETPPSMCLDDWVLLRRFRSFSLVPPLSEFL